MKTLLVDRRNGNDLKTGKFSDWKVLDSDFICVGVERPWVDADNNGIRDADVSCIIPGEYDLVWTLSPRMHIWTYEVLNVPGASGIRIHSANWAHQLKGCLAPGHKVELVENPHTQIKSMGVSMSGITLKKLENVLERKPAKLIITDRYQNYLRKG